MNEKSGKGTLAVLGIAGAFVLVCIVTIVLGAIGFYNGAVNLETGIKASYSDNQNVYDNYSKKVMEAAQIPEKYESALKEIYKVAIGARYGKQGSKAVFQWIQEHNPTVDSAVYTKVQDIIESGRNEFQANQTSLIKRKNKCY